MLTRKEAQILCEAFEVSNTLDDEEESELLFQNNRELLEAMQALHDISTSEEEPESCYPAYFENAWVVYPKRAGGNPKRRAYKAWLARVKGGVDPQRLLCGVKRYTEFCKATCKEHTEFVMQAATFFGPDEHFNELWTPPKKEPSTERPSAKTDGEVLALGKQHKIEARPGESMDQYRMRILRAIYDNSGG